MVEQRYGRLGSSRSTRRRWSCFRTSGMLAVLLYGSYQAIDGDISVGQFATFFTYVLMLVEPAGRIAYWMVLVQEAMAGEQRVDEILNHPVENVEAEAEALPPGPAAVSIKGATMRYPDTAAGPHRRRSRGSGDGGGGDRRRDRERQEACSSSSTVSTTWNRGSSRWTAPGRPDRARLAATGDGCRGRRRLPVLLVGARQHRLRPPRRYGRRGPRGRASCSRRRVHRGGSDRDTTRRSARAASPSRAASASGSRWPAPCWSGRGSSCSTTRPAASTPAPSRRCSRTSASASTTRRR